MEVTIQPGLTGMIHHPHSCTPTYPPTSTATLSRIHLLLSIYSCSSIYISTCLHSYIPIHPPTLTITLPHKVFINPHCQPTPTVRPKLLHEYPQLYLQTIHSHSYTPHTTSIWYIWLVWECGRPGQGGMCSSECWPQEQSDGGFSCSW